jgi:hypothetical protein
MHMLVDSALIVAAASRTVQSPLVALERWLCDYHAFAVEMQLLRHNVNLGSTLTLEEMVRFPTRQTILNWVSQFRSTASALPENNLGRT